MSAAENKIAQPKIRVAVVGVGDFGRNHVRVYREMPEAELVGVVDANAARAAQVAIRIWNSRRLPGMESLRGRVDAVSLAVPTVEHARIGCALLRMGLDVLVEKPIAASLAEADELIAAARESGRILQIGPSGAFQSRGHRCGRNSGAPAIFRSAPAGRFHSAEPGY